MFPVARSVEFFSWLAGWLAGFATVADVFRPVVWRRILPSPPPFLPVGSRVASNFSTGFATVADGFRPARGRRKLCCCKVFQFLVVRRRILPSTPPCLPVGSRVASYCCPGRLRYCRGWVSARPWPSKTLLLQSFSFSCRVAPIFASPPQCLPVGSRVASNFCPGWLRYCRGCVSARPWPSETLLLQNFSFSCRAAPNFAVSAAVFARRVARCVVLLSWLASLLSRKPHT